MKTPAKYGLPDEVIEQITGVFARFPKIEQVIIFGSRAKGSYKPGSDIDLALAGNNLDLHLLNAVNMELDDLLLPYTFDITIHHRIENPDLLAHIERVGRIVYEKRKNASAKKAVQD